ncbi:HsdM family class I SAM-dependent methyltransferase [Nonomuraea montanisoli]|uniref:HsdM family class I SAM-dependent methyltransferase n=1 Tax=Nonomuraea montanisoli TaxID=2741721 RepID=UPI001F2E2E6A|nr:N-6 DNA methylase [Nonomuraea montanisoli]
MSHDPTVNAGDIARLAGVGRAAVSNWRRRHDDFPRPVGGTANQPLFSLRQVEAWLRRYGKSYQVSLGDRVWQRLKAAGDLRLGDLVAEAGEFLSTGSTELEPELAGLVSELAERHGPLAAYEFLCERYLEAHSRQLSVTREDVAELMVRLVGAAPAADGRPTLGHPTVGRPAVVLTAASDGHRVKTPQAQRAAPTGHRAADSGRAGGGPAGSGPAGGSAAGSGSAGGGPAGGGPVGGGSAGGGPAGGGEPWVPGIERPATILDPACGVGTLLLAPKAARLLGQDLSGASARITAARLRLRGADARIVPGDAIRHDAFAGEKADAVLCDPPFNERAWGYEELTGDPRWEYGLPPRGEPELAWVQHCLTHVRPGGLVAILMPPAAASRKAGRRIRANLLRAGALRGVVALPGSDLWLLRRPRAGERPPSDVLILDATADLSAVEPAWRAYLDDRSDRTVRIIDLLADEVDMTPARHQRRDDVGRAFTEARDRFLAAAATPPDLKVLDQPLDQPATTVGDLIKEGLVTVLQAPPKMAAEGGDLPVLTADDVAGGTPPSGRASAQQGLVQVRPGDVVASYSSVRVMAEGGCVLGPHLTLYRVDQRRLDPDFLAGFLRAAGGRATTGSSRFDVRRTRLPRLTLKEQSAYGEAFRQLAVLEDALRETSVLGQTLIRLGLDGLADGHLHPPAHGFDQ